MGIFNNKSKQIRVIDRVNMFIPEDMAWAFDSDGFHEKNVRYWMERLIKKQSFPVVYDIGANYGYYTLYLSQFAKHIYSFEPTESVFMTLKANIERNKLKNINPFNLALSDHEGLDRINVYSSSGNNSLFQRDLPEGHALRKMGIEEIELKSLDILIQKNNLLAPTFVKIDTEGAELFILRGGRRIITDSRPVIFMEYSENTYKDAGYSKEDVLEYLHELDYSVFGIVDDLDNMTLYPEKEFVNVSIANIIAIPEGTTTD